MNSRRSFVFMSGGALLGLAMAGYSLFTARGTSTLIVPAEDVALVNQQPLSRSDYLIQLKSLYGTDFAHATARQLRAVLDDMIREELFVQRAKELDVAATDPDVRSAMVNSVEQEIAADAVTSQPTERQLRDYFERHRARYASEGIMTLRDYVLPAAEAASAGQLAAALAGGPPSAQLLSKLHAADSAKAGDRDFYFAVRIHLGDGLFEAAQALTDGSASAPIADGGAVHVLYMIKNERPVPFDFAAARDQVLTDYRNDAIGQLRIGDEAFLRKRANVLIADDLR